jgi:hypothetical protein
MKHACPRCQALSISGIAKRWSDRASPAACGRCGGLSHVLASTASGIGVGTLLILVASMVIAAGAMSYPLAVSGMCLSAAFNIWAWRRAELIPIPKENVANARVVRWFLAGIYALIALFGN